MSTIKESKMKPGAFMFTPYNDWIVIRKLNIKSKYERMAERSKLNLVPGQPPKNLLDIERQKAQEISTYDEYIKEALDVYEGKHGHQGIVKAIGPRVPEEFGIKKGDKVYFRGNSGEPIVHNKQLYWVLKPHEVYGKAPMNEHQIDGM